MDVDIDDTSTAKENSKATMVLLVGAPGSGKSTFCDNIMRSSTRSWVRICQDTINNGKAGTRPQCLKSAITALNEGKNVFIDRCNLDKEQRAEFVKLGNSQVDVHAVMFDLPAQLCISRSVKRTGHEGNLQGGKAAAVVNRMLQKKEFPKLNEGFTRITFCQNENDVQNALNMYSQLGPLDMLPQGCFGQRNQDAKVQLGIMKFLKKVGVPSAAGSNVNNTQEPVFCRTSEEKNSCLAGEDVSLACISSKEVGKSSEDLATSSVDPNNSSKDVPTLAFPSISTADFQFNHEKASDIIVEKVEEFMNKLGNVRLVLVDLTHGSKILSLVRSKAAQKNIDKKRFFTFVGDITKLSSGGLHCNFIANAANWRLKPGGGGVNAAIFDAAGSVLEVATKERAKSLLPGNAVVVPLPSTSPLYIKEGVTHVIHVLGPNMNPQRPNYLNNDYIKGCKILHEAYASLFEGFLSIVRNQVKLPMRRDETIGSEASSSASLGLTENAPNHQISWSNRKNKDISYENEKSKKCKGSQNEDSTNTIDPTTRIATSKSDKTKGSGWGSWAQALYHIAMHPERHKEVVLEVSDDFVVLNDLYPKARKHLLVVGRYEGLDCLADVCREHLQLLMTMHDVGLKWAKNFLNEDASLVFRLGYHSVPSMRQLHLHVISQDFNTKHLKNKKHWNSFTTTFFRDSVDVIEEMSKQEVVTVVKDDSLLSMELRCHRCRSAHPNIPRLKSHISNCQSPFPATLLQNSRLVLTPSNSDSKQ